jgi:menaquinol-cytochrome c reductase iron-sulfur subunit
MSTTMSSPQVVEHRCPGQATSQAARRGFLKTVIATLTGGIAAALAGVVGGAAVGPSFARAFPRWVRAGRLDDFETDVPTPVTLRVTRQDGYLETVDQHVVFVTRSANGKMQAVSSSCSHLGCSVAFDRQKEQFLCPCHLGSFHLDGSVAGGPPPKPLEKLTIRVEKARVFVQV